MQHEWMNDNFREAGRYLLRLVCGGLHGINAGDKPDTVSWKLLYNIAKHNSIEGLVYCGIRHLAAQQQPEPELKEIWENDWNLTCYRQLCFDTEREEILAALFKEGVSCLPLKGILLAHYYPEPGMRAMADNDILYGILEKDAQGKRQLAAATSAQQILVRVMHEKGYSTESLKSHHDIFQKKPFYNFEMHRQLMPETSQFSEYYRNPWENAVSDRNHPFLYTFSPEEEYLFLLAHAFKHYDSTGCGIRFLVDIYVFLQRKGNELDRDVMQAKLRQLDLTAFETEMREIAMAAFHPSALSEDASAQAILTEEQEEIVFYLLGCGIFGTVQSHMERKMEKISEDEKIKHAKWQYVKGRLFLSDEECKDYYPFFYRHKVFRPILPGYRIIRSIFVHPKKLFQEAKQLKRVQK